jgi:hypothetical protein
MSGRRFLLLSIGALIVLGVGLYLGTQRNVRTDSLGTLFLPALARELDSVTELDVFKGAAAPTVTVHKVGAAWAVAQRADYPADAAKVRKLLLALGDAKIVEEKTANPANFPIIGVEDPTRPGAGGAQVTVVAHDGRHTVIVGKPSGEGNFARRGGENTSYAVEPAISIETEPRAWIEARLIDIPSASIESIEVKPATGAGYSVHRLKPKEDDFSLEGIPAGRKALDAHALAPSASMLSSLDADDVSAAGDLDFSKATQAVVTLADGNVITLSGIAAADKHWIEVSTVKDEALNAKTKGRAFEIASYRYDAIFRPIDQLLVAKPAPPPANAAKPAPAKPKPAAAPTP